jgi:Flp pilus assembly protein protease CpaA
MISIFYEASVCFVLVFYLTENQKSWKIQNVLVVALAVKMEIVQGAAVKTAQAQIVEKVNSTFKSTISRYKTY